MKNRIRVYVVPDLFRLSRHYFPAVSYDGRLSLVQHNILHQTGDIAVELIHSGTINFPSTSAFQTANGLRLPGLRLPFSHNSCQ